ncbi:hypothetical protein JCM11641_004516 [Rhodosporidiobolus odoratus]
MPAKISSTGKGGKAIASKHPHGKQSNKSLSASKRAGLEFPVGRVRRYLKQSTRERVGETAAIFLAAILESLKKARLTPRHLGLTIRGDEELDHLFEACLIAGGGVLPHIHKALTSDKSPFSSAGKKDLAAAAKAASRKEDALIAAQNG